MSKIRSVTKMTENPFLNMYYLDAENRLGGDVNYYVASRASSVEEMKLVKKDPRQKKIINCPTDELIRNVEIIEEDIKTLSDKKVLLNGINPENTTFNGKLYLTDPSKYRILDIGSTEELEKLNNYQFYILLTNLIIKELNKSHISASTIQRMKELLSLKDDSIYYSDYLEEILEDNSSIKTLIKKI